MSGIYKDEGISGTSTKRRKDFKRMIADAQNKKMDLILCASVSRFARDIGALTIAYITLHHTSNGALVMTSSYCILQIVYLVILISKYIKTIKYETISC